MALQRVPTLLRRSIDAVVLGGLSLAALYVGAREGLAPRDAANGVAVVFAPWTAPDAALSRSVEAGGRFVRFGGLPFVAVVMPDDASYPSRILSTGAWLVVDPQALAACLSPFTSNRTS